MRKRIHITPITVRFPFLAKYMFGTPEDKGLDAYRLDNSGPLEKPIRGSDFVSQDRIDHLRRQTLHRALLGPGMASTTSHFRLAIRTRIKVLADHSAEWTISDDFYTLVGKAVSGAIIEALFGPSLLRLCPDFVDDLWTYDSMLHWLVRLIPRWVYSRPHKARDSVLQQIKEWHINAQKNIRENNVTSKESSDPYWGSEMVRHLHKVFGETGKHSNDAISSHDLGLIWG
jgi:hypothetical protein